MTINPGFVAVCGRHVGKSSGPQYRRDIVQELAHWAKDKGSSFLRAANLFKGNQGAEANVLLFVVREGTQLPESVGQWKLSPATAAQEKWARDLNAPVEDFPV